MIRSLAVLLLFPAAPGLLGPNLGPATAPLLTQDGGKKKNGDEESQEAKKKWPPAKVIEEPRSDVGYPEWGPAPDSREIHTLTGVGVRTKTVFDVKVYAFGMYVDAVGAREHLADWKGKTTEELQDDKKFYAKLLENNFSKSMRLVMVRDVDGDDFSEAFEDALAPRVREAARKKKLRGGAVALETFKGFFDIDEITDESEIIFTWYPGGKLITIVNGEQQPAIQNKALCWSLFDVYLGTDPIERKGKDGIVARFPGILDGTTETPASQDELED